MICTARFVSLDHRGSNIALITHHVSHMVLTCPFLCNEALDAEENDSVILNHVLVIRKTAQEEEPPSLM